MLWGVGVGLPVAPENLDLRIKSFRPGFVGQLPAHEHIEGVNALSDGIYVLRHRLPRHPDGGKRRVRLLVAVQSHDLAVADRHDLC